MIPLMDSTLQKEARVLWSFWLACGLAVTGGIAPLLLAAGGTNRVAVALIPFGVAAAAMAVDALIYDRGRPIATALYFVASIALVYGMLSMIAVPLRVAVLGTCPSAPAACPIGFEQPLTAGENSGLAIGIAMGTLAILVGFFGLLMLYRIKPQVYTTPPPVRRDAPVAPAPAVVPPAPAQEPEPVAVAPAAAEPEPAPAEPAAPAAAVAEPPPPPPPPARKPRARRAPKLNVEPPPTEERLELPPPEEVLELPETGSPDKPSEDTPTPS
jgi:hypothetical protein